MENKNISLEAIRIIVKEETKDFATRKEMVDFKDQILTGQDNLSKKLDQILSEHPAMSHAIDENREEIHAHEKRIKKLEVNPAIA